MLPKTISTTAAFILAVVFCSLLALALATSKENEGPIAWITGLQDQYLGKQSIGATAFALLAPIIAVALCCAYLFDWIMKWGAFDPRERARVAAERFRQSHEKRASKAALAIIALISIPWMVAATTTFLYDLPPASWLIRFEASLLGGKYYVVSTWCVLVIPGPFLGFWLGMCYDYLTGQGLYDRSNDHSGH
jgi:hypothetical protein